MIQKEQIPVKEATNKNEKVIKGNDNLTEKKELKVSSGISRFAIEPFIAGLFGFAAFLMVLVGTEFLAYVIHDHGNFSIDPHDVILSSLGFICFFLISLIRNTQKK